MAGADADVTVGPIKIRIHQAHIEKVLDAAEVAQRAGSLIEFVNQRFFKPKQIKKAR